MPIMPPPMTAMSISGFGIAASMKDDVSAFVRPQKFGSAGRAASASLTIFSTALRRSPDSGMAWHAYAVIGADRKNLGKLDVLDQIGRDVEVEQRPEPAVDGERLVAAALPHQLVDRHRLAREGVDQPGDPADRTDRQRLEGEVVDAGEQIEAVAEAR